jgi:hypothetical protein
MPRGLTCKFRTRGKLCTRRRKSVPDKCFSYTTKFVYMTNGVYRLNPGADMVKCRTWRGHSGQAARDDRRPPGASPATGPGRSNAGLAQGRPGDGQIPQGLRACLIGFPCPVKRSGDTCSRVRFSQPDRPDARAQPDLQWSPAMRRGKRVRSLAGPCRPSASRCRRGCGRAGPRRLGSGAAPRGRRRGPSGSR